jgi:DNA helicase II / ATP-dependent DNA helicase PcrA
MQNQNLLHHLNPEQLAAVTLPAQSALILAGAGSGKTRVLITRIAWLIHTEQVSLANVLAVTFTNKSAKEMVMRLSAILPINIRGMWIDTFHGLCNRLLRTHYHDAGLPQTFQILDSQDQLAVIKRLLKLHNIDDEKYPPRSLMYFINNVKEQGLRSNKVEADDDHSRKLGEFYVIYENYCRLAGLVDFAELLLRTYELLSLNQPLREHYQARFRHILVDEFQDTNDLQYKWLKLMTGQHGAVFAVGDDDQSIYAFRGANVGNMAAFEREFQVKNIIKLEQNYRSHGHILDTANKLIENNHNRLGKNLHTVEGYGEPVQIYEASSDFQEAQWLVTEVKSLVDEGGALSDIAILYRSNAQSRVIEHALLAASIPYHVYGGLRYFQRAEVKHAVAYLQLLDNLDNDLAFRRVVNFPPRGNGLGALEKLESAGRHYGLPLHMVVHHVQGKAGISLGKFFQLIEKIRFDTQHLPLPKMIEIVLQESGLIAHYQKELKVGDHIETDHIENLQQLVSAATQFLCEEGLGLESPAFLGPRSQPVTAAAIISTNSSDVIDANIPLPLIVSPLTAFLSHASLEAGDNQAKTGQDALQLMTVHSAKGLEFNAVFITGLEEGLFPHENSTREAGGLEEERRLMYVAITRARRRLYMSFSRNRMLHGQPHYNRKSRFFDELPEAALKWLSPKTKPHWSGKHKSAWDDAPISATNTIVQNFVRKECDWHIGETVLHARFGEGVIVNIEGSGSSTRAQINFGPHGLKLLDLSIAKLEKVLPRLQGRS